MRCINGWVWCLRARDAESALPVLPRFSLDSAQLRHDVLLFKRRGEERVVHILIGADLGIGGRVQRCAHPHRLQDVQEGLAEALHKALQASELIRRTVERVLGCPPCPCCSGTVQPLLHRGLAVTVIAIRCALHVVHPGRAVLRRRRQRAQICATGAFCQRHPLKRFRRVDAVIHQYSPVCRSDVRQLTDRAGGSTELEHLASSCGGKLIDLIGDDVAAPRIAHREMVRARR